MTGIQKNSLIVGVFNQWDDAFNLELLDDGGKVDFGNVSTVGLMHPQRLIDSSEVQSLEVSVRDHQFLLEIEWSRLRTMWRH